MSSGSNSGRDDDSHSDEYSDSGEYSSNMDSDIGDVIGRNVSAKKYSSSSEGHRVVKGKGSTEVNKLVFQGSLDKTRRMCSTSTIETGSIASGRSITISNAGSRGSSVMVISTTENIRGNVVNFNERSALECLHQAEEVTSLSQNTLTLATDSAGSVRIESTAPLPKGVLGYLKELVSVNNNNSKNNNDNDGELNGKGYKSKNGIKINPINKNKHIDYSCKSSKNSDISSIGVNGVETKSIRISTKKAPGHKGGLIPITLLYKSNKIYKNSSGEIATVNKFLNQSLKRPTTKGDLFVAEKISFCEDLLKKLQNKKLMLLKSIQEAALNDELVEFEKYCEELELLDRLAQDVGCYIEEKTSDIVRITPGSATITVSMPHEPAVSDGLKKRSLPTHINADNVSTDSGKHKVFATKHKRKFSLSQNRAKKTGLNGEMVIYTIYIQLALPSLTLSWSVNKTYSDLIELHTALKKEFPMFVKPTDLSLNKPNSLFFSRPARMLRNKQLIQKYLETLLANKSICDSCIFRQLLTSTAPPDLAALRKFTWILSNRDVNGSHITQLAAHYHPLTTEDHNTTRYSRYSSSISHASTQSSGVSGLTHSPIDLSANQQETSNNFHFPNETSISSSSPPSQNSPTFFKLRRRRVLSPVITKYSPYSALPGNKNVYTETAHKQHLKLLNDPFSASAKNDQISDILSIRDKSEPDQLSADGGPVNSNLLLPAILDNKKKIDKSWLLFDFISELFNLRSKNSSTWIRRQALYILFTNYINMHLFKNKAKRNPVTFISLPPAPTLAHYISTNLMDLLWPDRSKPFNPPPKQAFSTENYQKVKEKLAIVMPLLVGSLVGKKNSVEGPTRFLECIQIPRFNASYYLYIFDALIEFLFD
ncbi:hypothetical protein AX774_g4694 [Zancudomyces culisetae]|uniref:PX domain-containing protein n=1 Tax=Zancudomyces culisetae TaxID=1213189 RepID=A0A1R1PLJ0_ZANCU|nr:hypothetical protein AX774_g4694 [Zancudomyces culisetae]|eukprot:OMH81841.1 hypothetical protein AX774_g4694 [Zancudomyces culisetae]